jgi:hypothetical protein
MCEREDIERPFYTADLTVDDQEIWTPILNVQYGGSEVVQLHHFNTLVRLFENEDANHVEWRTKEGVKGIRMAQALIEMMVEYDYDLKWCKRVDESTLEWLSHIEADNLDDELRELQGE